MIGFCLTAMMLIFYSKDNEQMKNIIATALLLIAATAFSLACKKVADSNSSSNTGQSNSDTAQASPSASQSTTSTVKDQLLNELVAVERQLIGATIRGDKATMERIIANEFTARYGGQLYDKDSWIGSPKGLPNIASDDILKPELIGYTGDTATIHFDERATFNDNTAPNMKMVSVTFVKRNGNWQIKSLISGH